MNCLKLQKPRTVLRMLRKRWRSKVVLLEVFFSLLWLFRNVCSGWHHLRVMNQWAVDQARHAISSVMSKLNAFYWFSDFGQSVYTVWCSKPIREKDVCYLLGEYHGWVAQWYLGRIMAIDLLLLCPGICRDLYSNW